MPWERITTLTRRELAEVRRDRKKTRFLVDENMDIRVSELIRASGWNCVHASDVGLSGHADEDVLAYAHRTNRVLLTHDPDFLDNRAFPPHRNPGVVVLPGAQGNRRALVAALQHALSVVGPSCEVWRATKISIAADRTWRVETFESAEGRYEVARYSVDRRGWPLVWREDPEGK